MASCVVCLGQFSPSDISLVKFTDKDSRNRDKISCVYRKILRIFCKYFNLPCTQKENENKNEGETQEENYILSSFPFCVECRNLVAELCIFHEKSESIHKIIQNTVAKITMKIVQTESDKENCSNSDPLKNQKNGQRTRNKMKHEYRRKILQNFNPRVHLTDCQSQIQNRNQEKVPNEINSTTTIFESPVNDENHHDNSINNKSDRAAHGTENDVHDLNAETSVNSSDESQEAQKITEKNSSLNLASISLDETSESEKTRENLMQQIRAKFNTQPQDVPPLENSIQKKNQPSVSKQVKSKQNSLENKIRSDVVESLGDGKYLFQNSWPFHIIEDQEVFECGTCQSRFIFRKRHSEKVTVGVIKHIRRMHSNPKKLKGQTLKTVAEGSATFRLFKNWTFEKMELGFKCGHCPKLYTRIESMKSHIKKWHVPGEFECSKCPRSFQSQGLLKNHSCARGLDMSNRSLEISPGSGKFIYNGKKQNWDFELIDGKFQCLTCPAFRRKKVHLINHLRDFHDALTSHMCEECGRIFSQKRELTKHKLAHLKNGNPNDGRKQPRPKTPGVCPHCQKTFKSKAGLGIHIFRSHKDILMATTTTTQQEREEENGQGNSGILKYPCGKCTRIFTSPVLLKKHEDRHDELLDCPKCDKKFKSNGEAQAHLDRHNKVFKFFCDVCNKGFLQKWQVTRHKETGAHSQKDETVKSKEASVHFISIAKAKAQKGKRKDQDESESSKEEEEESGSENETDESESADYDANTTTEED